MPVQQSVYKKIGFGFGNSFSGCRIADFFFARLLTVVHFLLTLVNHHIEPGRWTLSHVPDFFVPLSARKQVFFCMEASISGHS